MGPIQMHREAKLTPPKKVKRTCTTIILTTLVHLLSQMICEKIQPQGILGSGEEDLFFSIFGYSSHLGQWPATMECQSCLMLLYFFLSKKCVNLLMHYVIILKTRVVLSIYNVVCLC